ncbi:MAG TPA: hypothetical protein VF192_11385 [Longimicrobiales bacterium]
MGCRSYAVRIPCVVIAALAFGAAEGAAQHAGAGHSDQRWTWGARAIGLATHASPALAGDAMTEAYVTQPIVALGLRAWGGRLRLRGMVNLEGLTLAGGELNAGAWGEGFVDRRHPHTYLHELVGTLEAGRGQLAASLTVGKGFAPYGTDDPAARPFVKFPVNHHLAQILERAVAVGAVRYGPVALEAGLFNGDEPQGPDHMPAVERFGDSWAARGTVWPGAGLELSASRAWLNSPEHPGGAGLDRRLWSAAARWEMEAGGRRLYALAEWARADELHRGERRFRFESVLVEASASVGRAGVALRLERTTRPEEERLADPFRSPRPHADFNIIGQTRWDIATIQLHADAGELARLRVRPFVEVALLRPTQAVRPSLFVPSEFYGSERLWSVSAGVRVEVGEPHARMGRYGAADPGGGRAAELSGAH